MVNVVVTPQIHDRLDRMRESDIGKVTYNDAIKALLDFWDDKHK